MFELMKVGERRINILRQINARQGFSSKDDTLPQRLFEKLPDGPAKCRCVDKDAFAEMCKQYYELMGWDNNSDNPRDGKLRDLGPEWAI